MSPLPQRPRERLDPKTERNTEPFRRNKCVRRLINRRRNTKDDHFPNCASSG